MESSERIGRGSISSFLLHIHPRRIPAETTRFALSFGLGGMAVTLFCVLVFTGLLQLLSYTPRMDRAYESVLQMYDSGSLAGFIRNIHYWSGNLLVIVCFLHMLRVYLTGALTGARRTNWIVGILIFGLILFANFTGYLLPNDQLAYWAVTIFTSMMSYVPVAGPWLVTTLRGGVDVGPATLSNFFAIHIGILPVLAFLLIIYHFWLIRKAKGLIHAAHAQANNNMVDAMPNLVFKELTVGLGLLALVLSFSAGVDAPLGSLATPGSSPNPTKAAWYFMGLQELLLHLHPTVVTCIIPIVSIGALILVPFIKGTVLPGGIWFGGDEGRTIAAWSALAGFTSAMVAVIADSLFSISTMTSDQHWLTRTIFPLLIYGVILYGWYLFWRKYRNQTCAEATMALVIFVTGSIMSLTLIGYWFRGEGMALVIPFLD